MLQPAKRKFRKEFRGKMRGKAQRGYELSFGDFGLKAMECGWITGAQIEAGRRAISHSLKKGGMLWIRAFPDKPITSRPAGQRMGGGKGEVDQYVAVIRPGKILFELAGVPEEVAKEAFRKAGAKLPIDVKFVS